MPREDLLESISALIEASRFPPMLTEHQLSEMTGISVSWYRQKRAEGGGPPIVFIPPRIIRYDRDAVLAWFREHEVER